MSKDKNLFNASFDAFANNYHSIRPGYPASLFEDIKVQCKINTGSHLLEIGAGSGIATVELAKLGCNIVAIEPGTHLATIAKRQTKQFKNVQIVEETFEHFQTTNKFEAILAFTAFHWLNEETKFQQVCDLLNDWGSLVLVWNSFFHSDSPVTADINKAYREDLSGVYPKNYTASDTNQSIWAKLNHREQEIIVSPLFYPIFLKKYLMTYNYNEETYPKLLNTFPKIVELEEEKRLKFLKHISEIIKLYGQISVPVLTTLIVCQKRKYFLKAVAHSKKV